MAPVHPGDTKRTPRPHRPDVALSKEAKARGYPSVLVIPDIQANAGGVIVSYFEWVQANQAYWWTEAEVSSRLRDRLTAAWDAVHTYSDTTGISLRAAATALAVRRVAEAHLLRGLYP